LKNTEVEMTLTGYLSEYSLPEVFNFVHQGNKTGLLSIFTDITPVEPPLNPHYLWFQSGRIIAVSTGTDGQGLLKAISQRKLVPDEYIEQLRTQVQKLQQPLGLHLKSRGLLTAEQLKLLFNSQSIAVVCKLFELNNGRFHFDPAILSENAEMTGISMPAQEIALLSLRGLRDWANLSNKLPDPQHAIQRLSSEEPGFIFNQKELQLWKLVNSETPLRNLTIAMSMSIESLQKTAYRLIVFGLVQEIPIDRSQQAIDLDMALPELVPIREVKNTVSTSFLGNLMGFLKKKG
jgi:Domain of unknown function (DUF4388)